MVGLNVEMGRELLWRGFPTDQRGTYFRHFWGNDGAAAARQRHRRSPRRTSGGALGTAPPSAPARSVRAAAAQQPAAPLSERDHLLDAGGRRRRAHADRRRRCYPSSAARWSPTSPSSASDSRPAAAIGVRRRSGLLHRDPGASDRAALRPRCAARTALRRTKSHLPIGTQPPAGVPLKGRPGAGTRAHMAASCAGSRCASRSTPRNWSHADLIDGRPEMPDYFKSPRRDSRRPAPAMPATPLLSRRPAARAAAGAARDALLHARRRQHRAARARLPGQDSSRQPRARAHGRRADVGPALLGAELARRRHRRRCGRGADAWRQLADRFGAGARGWIARVLQPTNRPSGRIRRHRTGRR